MDDFSKYFKSMLDQLMKSGADINFDIKSFDLGGKETNGNNFMQMFFGGMPFDKKEKLAVRKLTEDEIQEYKDLLESKEKLQSQFRRLMNQQKKLEADFELFWQDMKETSKLKTELKDLSVDLDSGFLFQQVHVNQKDKQEEE